MTHQELELWSQDIISDVLKGQRIEDSKIELKSSWPNPDKAAHSLAAHANAARGTAIVWLIGVDEKAQRLTNANPVELANWFQSVERLFDGDAPRMVLDANVSSGNDKIVALYFETHQGAPFVVKNASGGYPQFVVPWRESTGKRAASRYDLLRILVPIRRFSALVDELNYNLALVQATPTNESLGTLFREEEFHRALSDGALSTLTNDERQLVTNAYLGMNRANQLVTAAVNSLALTTTTGRPLDRAWQAVKDCQKRIEAALAALSPFLK